MPAFVPPAPEVYPQVLPPWRLMRNVLRSTLSIWADVDFETPFRRNRVLGIESIFVSDPDGVRHIMIANAANYRRPLPARRVLRPVVGDGVLVAEGAVWRRQRRLLAPRFTPASIGILLPHFQEAGLHLLRQVEGGSPVNLSRMFQDTALEAVLRALFSLPENEARARLGALARSYPTGAGRPTFLDGFARSDDAFRFATGSRRRFQQAWFGAIEAIIRDRKAAQPEGDERDLLDLLLGLRDAETGETLADEEIRDQCGTMFAAGSETTARLLLWASYLLTQDVEEQARVQAEIASFPPDRVGSLDDLKHWPHLRNVLLEAMRLYPPVPHIVRETIGPDEVCGERLPANTQVWISPWVMHRHRRFWEHPTAFMPDRFAGKSAPWVQMPAYVPFGVGPRICLGLNFALAEAQIVLARLLARYRISLENGPVVLPVGKVAIEPSYEPDFKLERLAPS